MQSQGSTSGASPQILVAGLGLTGQSVLAHFARQGMPCLGYDTRVDRDLSAMRAQWPQCDLRQGAFEHAFSEAECQALTTLVLSPGIDPRQDWVVRLRAQGVAVVGDVELFARQVTQPVVAITGSNGKSTVTTLVTQALTLGGYEVAMGGNIGRPVLDLLADPTPYDVYVLELSSFQLETTRSLACCSAAVLNLSADHMDRYPDFASYIDTKLRLLKQTAWPVIATACFDVMASLSMALPDLGAHAAVFGQAGLSNPLLKRLIQQYPDTQMTFYGECQFEHQAWLCRATEADQPPTQQVPVAKMGLQQPHDRLNALAMLALCAPFGLPDQVFADTLAQFTGLAHRMQSVGTWQGVHWINDSKGTNVGATLTAIASVAAQTSGRVCVLLGGVSKGADFSALAQCVQTHVGLSVVFGQDRALIAQALAPATVSLVPDLTQAVQAAAQWARPGDTVLLSPACASFDQFRDFIARGEAFVDAVEHLAPSPTKDRS